MLFVCLFIYLLAVFYFPLSKKKATTTTKTKKMIEAGDLVGQFLLATALHFIVQR